MLEGCELSALFVESDCLEFRFVDTTPNHCAVTVQSLCVSTHDVHAALGTLATIAFTPLCQVRFFGRQFGVCQPLMNQRVRQQTQTRVRNLQVTCHFAFFLLFAAILR